MGEDGNHAGESLGGACIYPHDAASRDLALHREQVERVIEAMLVGIGGRPGDLLRPVPAVEGRAGGLAFGARAHRSPDRSSSLRVMALRASGTLEPFSRKGAAPASSA